MHGMWDILDSFVNQPVGYSAFEKLLFIIP
jgi:hypothetical protein